MFLDARLWLRFEWLALRDPRLKRSLAEGLDVDLSPVLLRDLRAALAVDLPGYLLLREQMRRFTLRYRPTHLLTILETYCYGRAVTMGVRAAESATRVVGLQHSPVNANQLFYRYLPEEMTGADALPVPDLFLLHSRLAERMLSDAGVSADRLRLVGAPRFALLADYRQRRASDRAGLRRALGLPATGRVILVAGVIWPEETTRLFRWAFTAAAGLPDVTLAIKPHPIDRGVAATLAALAKEFPAVTWQRVDHPLNALQAAADVMVTGNSSSDTEALAIGCPVIKTATFDLGSSPTDDFPGSVIEVQSVEELARALALVPPVEDDCPVVAWAIGPVDKLANAHIAEALTNV
jgi:surface carbohydrate biosynthesis protein (TIGR04326 family)